MEHDTPQLTSRCLPLRNFNWPHHMESSLPRSPAASRLLDTKSPEVEVSNSPIQQIEFGSMG